MEVLLSINHDVYLHETTRRDRRLLTDETGDLDFESDLRKFQQTKPSQYQEPLRAFPKIELFNTTVCPWRQPEDYCSKTKTKSYAEGQQFTLDLRSKLERKTIWFLECLVTIYVTKL